MEKLKSKKIIGISLILILIITISLITYGKNKSNVFKDEYMNNIFVDEGITDLNNTNEDNNVEDLKEVKIDNKVVENNNKEVKINNKVVENSDKKEEKIDTSSESNNNIIVVEIKGEVLKPDVYKLNEGSIIKDLIEVAGGLTNQANISNINRAKELKNHELIIIRNINDISNINDVSNINVVSNEDASSEIVESEENVDNTISINEADLNKLKEIPGIGDVKANAILMYREKNGGFKSIEELKNVDGIGEKTFEKIKDSIKL